MKRSSRRLAALNARDGLLSPQMLNKPGVPGAKAVEGSRSAEGNATSTTRAGHRAGQDATSALDRVRRKARAEKEARFTAPLHHVDVDRLRMAFWGVEPKSCDGIDGVSWRAYGGTA